MTVNVGKGFLNQAEDCGLQDLRKPAQLAGHVQGHFEAAAGGESVDIPAERRNQACFVEKRRMQQVRHGSKLAAHFFHHGFGVLENALPLWIGTYEFRFQPVHIQLQSHQQLPRTVVQFAGDSPALFILRLQQEARKLLRLGNLPLQFRSPLLHSRLERV